jgi:hypothetical protein
MSAFAKEVEVAKEMGLALPLYDTHAVSVSSFLIDFFDFIILCLLGYQVSLPLWTDVIGYEEAKVEVINHMVTGYPRFRFHNTLQALNLVFSAILQLKNSGLDKVVQVFGEQSFSPEDHGRPVIQHDNSMACLLFATMKTAKRFQQFMVRTHFFHCSILYNLACFLLFALFCSFFFLLSSLFSLLSSFL